MKKPIFTGASVAIITPFHADGSVNYEEFKKIIDYQIAHGTDCITIVGTTGEGSALHDAEHRDALAFGVEYINHRVPVIAGAGSNHTDYAVELTKFCKEIGADAVLSVTPYYNKTTQKGLISHYHAIADCGIPVILYNVPSRTGMCIKPETYFELSKHPMINGAKEASGDFSAIMQAMQLCGDNLNFWSGNDDQIVPLMSMGFQGVISVLSNVAPQVTHAITAHCFAGEYQKAMQLQLAYLPLINALFSEVNPIPVKAAMNMLGWAAGPLRMPLVDLSEEHAAALQHELHAMDCKIEA